LASAYFTFSLYAIGINYIFLVLYVFYKIAIVLYEQRNPLEWYFTSHGATLHKKFVQSICGVVYTKSAEKKKSKTCFNHLKSFRKKMNIIVS